jgi:Citrate transporter
MPIRPWRQVLTLDQVLIFAILAGMVALFVWDRLRYDLVALLALLAAMASGVVPPEKAFVGFGDQVVIIVASVLVLSAAIGKSGVIGRVVRRLEPTLFTLAQTVHLVPSTGGRLTRTPGVRCGNNQLSEPYWG